MKETTERVANSPHFKELVTLRNRFSILMSLIVLGVYYAFVLTASVGQGLFSKPLYEGSSWPIGLVAGFAIQAFAFVMTGIYAARANGRFATLLRKATEEAGR